MKNLWIVLVVTLMIPAAVFGGGQDESRRSPDGEEIIRLRTVSSQVFAHINVPADLDPLSNPFIDIYKRAFPNVELEFILVPSSEWRTKQTTMVNAGDAPDILNVNTAEIIRWAGMGMIIDLTDLIEEHYHNADGLLTQNAIDTTRYQGRRYAVPMPQNDLENPVGTYIREDWMKNLGLEMPTTVEELYRVMHAFTFDDPNDSGANDTFGFGADQNFNNARIITGAYNVANDHWSTVDGTIVPDIITNDMKEALLSLRRLYADGIMDKDTLIQTGGQVEQKATQGLYGVYSFASYGNAGRITPNMKAVIGENANYVTMPPISAGNRPLIYQRNHNVSHRYAISARTEHPEVPVQIFNWLWEQDKSVPYVKYNVDDIFNGPIGITSEIIGNRFIMETPGGKLTPEGQNLTYKRVFSFTWGSTQPQPDSVQMEIAQLFVDSGLTGPAYLDDKIYGSEYAHFSEATQVGELYSANWENLYDYFAEVRAGIVSGSLRPEAFDEWVQFFYANGGREMVDEINELNR